MSLLGSSEEIFLEAVRVREEEMLLCLRQMPYNWLGKKIRWGNKNELF